MSSPSFSAQRRTFAVSPATRDGIIRVCTQCNTGYHWLGPLLSVYRRKHPRVTVNVAADATDRPVAALLDGHVDLAILVHAVADPRLRLRTLFTDEMVAVVASSSPLARRRWISAEELAVQHLLLYSSVPEESFVFRELFTPAGLVPARVSFIMLTEAMIELAQAGIGVGVLPRWSAQRANRDRRRRRSLAHAARHAPAVGCRDAGGAGRSPVPHRFHRSARRARAPGANRCRRYGMNRFHPTEENLSLV